MQSAGGKPESQAPPQHPESGEPTAIFFDLGFGITQPKLPRDRARQLVFRVEMISNDERDERTQRAGVRVEAATENIVFHAFERQAVADGMELAKRADGGGGAHVIKSEGKGHR